MEANPTLIAVLDDEPEVRKALRRVLVNRKFDVDEYGTAGEFLVSLESRQPDCLLLDLQMPGADGFYVLETLQSRNIHLPVVVVSAHDEPGTAELVIALGASACLKKPVEKDVLFSAIEAATASTSRK